MTKWTRRHKFKIGDRVELVGERTLAEDLYTLGIIDEPPNQFRRRGTIVGYASDHGRLGYKVMVSKIVCEVVEHDLQLLNPLDALSEILGEEEKEGGSDER